MSDLIKRSDVFAFFADTPGEPGSAAQTAKALNVSRSTISQHWDDVLSLELSDKIRGACVRLGKRIPPAFMSDEYERRQADIKATPVWKRKKPLRKVASAG